jgi:alkylation response protein AidB-like acyl-CoA dehydrogenase
MRDAIRSALQRSGTVAAAREATGSGFARSVWPQCRRLDLPGLLVPDDRGGLGLGITEAAVCLEELGRALACHPLRGHWLGLSLLPAAGRDLVEGERRACAVFADELETGTTVTGRIPWVPDAVGADLLVVVAGHGSSTVLAEVAADADGVTVEPTPRYDSTTNLARVCFDHAPATMRPIDEATARRAWAASQIMRAADAVGVARASLEMSIAHARQRYAFGRPIGSYQAVKHSLVEVFRLVEIAAINVLHACSTWDDHSDEADLAAAAARSTAGRAEELATKTAIFVHGGMGATWEHDAPYFYRRSQLSRLLLGGTGGASEAAGRLLVERAVRERTHV